MSSCCSFVGSMARFACVVCRHCPVFDTVAVLSIHRQGKKHLASKFIYKIMSVYEDMNAHNYNELHMAQFVGTEP